MRKKRDGNKIKRNYDSENKTSICFGIKFNEKKSFFLFTHTHTHNHPDDTENQKQRNSIDFHEKHRFLLAFFL